MAKGPHSKPLARFHIFNIFPDSTHHPTMTLPTNERTDLHPPSEPQPQASHFGEHLMIDGYGGSFEKLNDEALVRHVLEDLPAKLDMEILGGPNVQFCEGNDHKDPGGWTGVVTIKESHISVHTFPARGFVSIDAYTCKNNMDTAFITEYFTATFGLQEVEVNFVKRGTRYPQADLLEVTLAEDQQH